jgi:hypothetical protein
LAKWGSVDNKLNSSLGEWIKMTESLSQINKDPLVIKDLDHPYSAYSKHKTSQVTWPSSLDTLSWKSTKFVSLA